MVLTRIGQTKVPVSLVHWYSHLVEIESCTTNLHLPMIQADKLKAFRQEAYQHLTRAKDATFELTDAVLLTRHAYCLADLSLSPVFRRAWSSIYEALQDCRPQRHKLMQLYIKQMPTDVRPILSGDPTAWPRPDALS